VNLKINMEQKYYLVFGIIAVFGVLIIISMFRYVNLCERIEDTSAKEDCYVNYANITKNESYCRIIINPEKKDTCFEGVGVQGKNISICILINNTDKRYNCFYNVAINAKNTDYCDYIGMGEGVLGDTWSITEEPMWFKKKIECKSLAIR
jgi:hypothetical protein